MNNFIATVRYERIMENGKNKKVCEMYLVDAMSFTECESKVIKEIGCISGDFEVISEKKSIFEEVLIRDGDRYYHCKVNFLILEERTGEEKKQAHNYLLNANTIEDARKTIEEHFKGTMIDFEIEKIAETKIIDVIR